MNSRAELQAALEARGLLMPRLNPEVLMRLARRPRRPGSPVSTFYRDELAKEIERRRRNPLLSEDGGPGRPRLVRLTDPQDDDPLIALVNAAHVETMQEVRYGIEQGVRARTVRPVITRHQQRQALQLRRHALAVGIARRERGL